ncbi:MAG: hypothetical protein ACKVQA_16635 [Burkholderiales bacterium]
MRDPYTTTIDIWRNLAQCAALIAPYAGRVVDHAETEAWAKNVTRT